MSASGFVSKTVDVDKRTFLVQMLKFDNGNFVSVTEGSKKIGAMVASIGTGPAPTTATVIPSRTESLFLKLTAEKLSTITKGISIVTISVSKDLDSNSAKTLVGEIMELAKND